MRESRTQLSDLELYRVATERVAYEVERMSWPLLVGPADRPKSERADIQLWLDESLVESMLLHARNVIAFLVSKRPETGRPNATDVVADHYFDAGWPNRPTYLIGNDREEHDELIAEINRRLAHITSHGLWEPTGAIKPFHWSDVVYWLPKVLIGFGQFMDDLRDVHPDRAEWLSSCERMVEEAKK